MKRIGLLLWTAVLLAGLCACGKDSHRTTTPSATTTKRITATSSATTAAVATATTTTTTTAMTTTTAAPTTTTPTTVSPPPAQHTVANIALFGVDQVTGAAGRCDTCLILSVDYTNDTIKLTSLARDSLVPIQGHGEEKLTHAWAYGGAPLALDTIHRAFGLNVSDYIYVNFSDFATLIDTIGGVEVPVNDIELKAINYTGNEAEKLPDTGLHRLNGAQALRYVRCRTDSDTNRTSRQRTLLKAVLAQVKSASVAQITDLLWEMRNAYHTNLSTAEIIKLVSWMALQNPAWEEMSLPDGRLNAWGGILDKERGWVYVYDLDYAAALLQDFIYGTDTAETLPKPTRYQPH